MYIVMMCLMSYLIKWKLEKLLKRRDFGKIMLKQTSKIQNIVKPLKRDGASPHLRGSRCHRNFKSRSENRGSESDRDRFLFAIIQNHSRARAQNHSRRQQVNQNKRAGHVIHAGTLFLHRIVAATDNRKHDIFGRLPASWGNPGFQWRYGRNAQSPA